MNYRGGIALIKCTWSSWMQYRSFFFLLAFGWMIPPLIYLFVWSTAAGQETVGGMSRGEFVAYYLALIIVNQLTYSQTNWTVGDVIREGSFNSWLLRPMPPLFHALSSEIAGKLVFMTFTIPVGVVLGLVLRPEIHSTPVHVMLFLPALGMAWALRFFWGFWLALMAFWASRADALLALQDTLLFLLAGMVAPVSLLPSSLQIAARVMPFLYMIGFPVEVLTGSLNRSELLTGLLVQAGWLAFSILLSKVIWQEGTRRYTAVGG